MAQFHTINDLSGFTSDNFILTFNLSAAVVEADIGKPMTLDTTAGTAMKVAGDGAVIFGRLETFEDRAAGKVGAISTKFVQKFPVKAADLLAVGDTAVGSAISGEIKKAAANDQAQNYVIAIASGVATLAKL